MAAGQGPLSGAEVSHFMREGWVIKRACLDPALLAEACDKLWAENEVPRLQRSKPSSWLSPFSDEEASSDDHNQRGSGTAGAGAGRSWRCRAVANDTVFLDLLPRAIFPIAEQLMGEGTVLWPEEGKTKPEFRFGHPGGNFAGKGTAGHGCRGVYCLLPQPLDVPRVPMQGHVDGWAGDSWRMSAHCYLEDVTPGGGEFCLWPRSHRQLWHKHRGVSYAETWAKAGATRYGVTDPAAPLVPFAEEEPEAYHAELAAIRKDTAPVACALKPGDVVIWVSLRAPNLLCDARLLDSV